MRKHAGRRDHASGAGQSVNVGGRVPLPAVTARSRVSLRAQSLHRIDRRRAHSGEIAGERRSENQA
jgi:hypothetical protein